MVLHKHIHLVLITAGYVYIEVYCVLAFSVYLVNVVLHYLVSVLSSNKVSSKNKNGQTLVLENLPI